MNPVQIYQTKHEIIAEYTQGRKMSKDPYRFFVFNHQLTDMEFLQIEDLLKKDPNFRQFAFKQMFQNHAIYIAYFYKSEFFK